MERDEDVRMFLLYAFLFYSREELSSEEREKGCQAEGRHENRQYFPTACQEFLLLISTAYRRDEVCILVSTSISTSLACQLPAHRLHPQQLARRHSCPVNPNLLFFPLFTYWQ